MDRDAIEGYIANHLKLFISMTAGLLVFVGIIAVSIFFIALRGAEQTMVPEVRGKDLTQALLELQVKELYPRIQLRYSQSSLDKGQILEQEPRAGTIVKAGRRIRLVVSQGVLINSVENYLGRNVDEVRMDIQTLFASAGPSVGGPLLTLKEPFMYEFSGEPAGLILQQSPEPGSSISGPTVLEFVVSRGPENTAIKVPQLAGLSIADALDEISRSGIDFAFFTRPLQGDETGGRVVSQDPAGNSTAPAKKVVNITVTPPEKVPNGEVFFIFKYTLPPNPYPLSVRLEALLPSGERRRIFTVEYSGGDFTVPCQLPLGATLILSMLNREIHRETVVPQAESLSLDQL
ncbi:PASTA domain-containing protein [Spirochaetia bacterium]|nr:PASTA domain-containing protein [Spirochaetia bacterium]